MDVGYVKNLSVNSIDHAHRIVCLYIQEHGHKLKVTSVNTEDVIIRNGLTGVIGGS